MSKILFISTNESVAWGGSEVLWYETALKFIDNNHTVAISTYDWNSTPAHVEKLKAKGALIFLRKPDVSYSISTKIINKIIPIQKISKHHKEILNFKPEMAIISQGSNQDGIKWGKFCAENNVPYTNIVQAATEHWWPDLDRINVMKASYKSSLCTYFVSRANKELTEIQIAQKIDNSKVIFNPFNVDYNNNIKFPIKQTEQIYNLACVARHELHAKGQDILCQVFSQKKWKERPITVNLYGSGPHTSLIRDLIKLYDTKNIQIKGYEVPSQIWEQNHALILPSRFEGLPLALVEAMLCGRFGIVTNVSGNTEVLIDNENGFVAPAPKAEYLDEALERAWARREEWEEIGNNARLYIKSLVPSDPIQTFYDQIMSITQEHTIFSE